MLALIIDELLIMAFILVGMFSHGTLTLGDFESWDGIFKYFGVGFSFILAGFVVWAGLIVAQFYQLMPSGLIVWAGTSILGLLFRWMNGLSVDITFAFTSTLLLAVLLLGWRFLAAALLRNKPTDPEPTTAG